MMPLTQGIQEATGCADAMARPTQQERRSHVAGPGLALLLPAVFTLAIAIASGQPRASETDALSAPLTAASIHSSDYPVEAALDGNPETRWASRIEANHPDWLQLDLGEAVALDRVTVIWERALAVEYDVMVSLDGQQWETVARIRDPDGTRRRQTAARYQDDLEGLRTNAQFLKIACLRTGEFDLYSIWEIAFPEPVPAAAARNVMQRAKEARQQQRRLQLGKARRILADNGVQEIVLALREEGVDGHWYANFGYYAPDSGSKCYRAGGRLAVLDVQTSALRLLLDDPQGSVRDPCVSTDGTRILFSWRPAAAETFHLYTMGVDGTGLVQLTDGIYDDIEPTWLPDGDIAFVSSRCRRWVNCWLTQVGVLHRCAADGTNIRQISANIEHDNTPWVMPDGRILYQRWEYVDRSQVHYHHLWTANPDGTGQMIYFGNQNPGGVFIDAKPVPGTDEVVLIHSPGHGAAEHRGMVALVSPKRGPDQQASLRNLTSANYTDPYPISSDWFLAAKQRELVLIGRNGEDILLWEAPTEWPTLSVQEPRPLGPRQAEPVIPARTNPDVTTGTLFLHDIYRGRNLEGVKRGEITDLLVLESLPKPINFTGGMEPLSYGGSFTLERIVGTVPVKADGSACFRLPANRAFFFVALDAEGRSVKRMQSFTSVMPGETTGCVGCHEQRVEAPANLPARAGRSHALDEAPELPQPLAGIPDVMDFPRDIQPVLDAHCVSCHNPDERHGGVLLTGDRGPLYSHSYFTLSARRLVADGRNLPVSNYPPRAIGDSGSPLLQKMDGTHHEVVVPATEQRLIRCWINSGAAWPGTYAALGTGMLGGYAQNQIDRSDLAWPESEAAAEIVETTCRTCHQGPDMPLPGSPSDNLDMPPWAIDYDSPRLHFSRHIVFNLTRPEKSLLLLAPLAKEAGGYGACCSPGSEAGTGTVFASTDDARYQTLLTWIGRAATQLNTIKRFDMAGFRPRPEYLREMARYGIIPNAQTENAVDPYELDRRYWDLFRYTPPGAETERP